MPRFGPTVYVTYDESTGEYRVGETARGMRSRNIGGRGWPKSEKVLADYPAPIDKRERMAMEKFSWCNDCATLRMTGQQAFILSAVITSLIC